MTLSLPCAQAGAAHASSEAMANTTYCGFMTIPPMFPPSRLERMGAERPNRELELEEECVRRRAVGVQRPPGTGRGSGCTRSAKRSEIRSALVPQARCVGSIGLIEARAEEPAAGKLIIP